MNRREGLAEFYDILERLRAKQGGFKLLADCHGKMGWPTRGVYFFFEKGEFWEDGSTPRVVRIGTHAVSAGSQTTLWTRLSQHRGSLKGSYPGGGNHRGSVFRYLIGDALIRSGRLPAEVVAQSWGIGNNAPAEVRRSEYLLEKAVSGHIREMPFICLPADDSPGPNSIRRLVERNAIALLSNFDREPIHAPSRFWLGLNSSQAKVQKSGLWNVDHVNEEPSDAFLIQLRTLVAGADLGA